jgi:hypothetical protein
MASKHNFMTSFRPCGENTFSSYAWSPEGTHLYFQLVMTPYLMDAREDTKPTMAVHTTTPIGDAAWVTKWRVVIPVGPNETGEQNRLAIHDLEQQTVFHTDVEIETADAVQASGEPTAIFLLGKRNGEQNIWRIDTGTGEVSKAFPWLLEPPDTFTWQPAMGIAVLGRGDTVTLHKGESGETIATFPTAVRGSLHSGGRYLMLEHLGEEISIFYQRSWDELSEQARERELRRLQRFEETLAPGTPTKVQPPTLSWVDLTTGERYMMSSVFGDKFSWYEPSPFYGAFFLWGFEGKQFKRNVMLGQLGGRFRSIDKGRSVLGVERFNTGEDVNWTRPSWIPEVTDQDTEGAEPAPMPAAKAG